MAKSRLITAKEAIQQVFDSRLGQLTAAREDREAFSSAYHTLKKRVWETAEEQIKESFQRGAQEGRSLSDVTHIICAQITSRCMAIAEKNAFIPHVAVIEELCSVLERMPFTESEGNHVHRALEPILAKYGKVDSTGRHERHWVEPIVKALSRIPRTTPDTTPLVS